MTRSTVYFCTGALLFALAACSAQNNNADVSSQTTEQLSQNENIDNNTDANGEVTDGEPPEKPDGENGAPDGKNPPPDSKGDKPGAPDSGKNGGFGGSGKVTQGDSANTITEDSTISGESYSSDGDDENALRIKSANAVLSDISVNKSSGSSSNTEDGDFYGMNAALLATDKASVTIKNAAIKSSARNGNGVFSYGEGTSVNISDSSISTSADNSGGIMTTGGAAMNASDLTVTTSGNSAAAIRSDRGGGTVNVDGGSYTTTGANSPAVYSTADISIKNAELTAKHSEGIVIEGQNSVSLENCTVSGSMDSETSVSAEENTEAVMIYQSMSGDAKTGLSSFSMNGGSLTSENGDVFYVTNTDCTISLKNADIKNNSTGYLLRVCGNSGKRGWGTAGKNGANVTMTADSENLNGDIAVDTISTLDLTLKNGSTLTGTVNITDNADGGTAVDNSINVTIEKGCTWTLTGNCTLTSLDNKGKINYNGYTITLSDGIVLSK